MSACECVYVHTYVSCVCMYDGQLYVVCVYVCVYVCVCACMGACAPVKARVLSIQFLLYVCCVCRDVGPSQLAVSEQKREEEEEQCPELENLHFFILSEPPDKVRVSTVCLLHIVWDIGGCNSLHMVS